MGSSKAVDGMVHDGLWDHVNDFHMGMSAELVSEKYGVSRGEQDRFALTSYHKALDAWSAGGFAEEGLPVAIPRPGKTAETFDRDEVVRETALEALSALNPAFRPEGTVTAGNSSKISDGAAALVVASAQYAAERHLPILARVGAQASDGLDPRYVLMAPMLAVPRVLARAGLDVADIDLWEINEAFASSTVAVIRELDIDPEKVNVKGGAIALGHPIGASGARVLVTLLYAMKERDARRGLATLCLGGGEASP